ncbi:MAG: AEC family transporter [Tenericutes bacterium]|nr:AEC family transporter [Mycoplasmatota bacterium]
MDTLWFALNAVLPILILIGLGYTLKRVGFLNENFLIIGNRFVFRVALPILLFVTIYRIESFEAINWSVLVYAVIAIFILFFIGLIIALFFIKDVKRKGPVFQTVFRANYAIIGIPLAQAIGGEVALEVVALVSAVAVPLINILAVLALTLFIKNEDKDLHPFKATLINITKNPLIIAIFIGLFFLLVRSWIPVDSVSGELVFSLENNLLFLYTPLVWIRNMASPLALIVLGGTFEFLALKDMKKEVFIGTFARVVISPLLMIPLAVLLSTKSTFFNFTIIEYPALIALLASPTAISGAIMAKEMHNDEKLAVQLVVWTSTLSIFSIFLVVFIMRSFGLV